MPRLIILASSSPRRIDLLKQVRIPVLVRSPDVDETPVKGELPRAMVSRLARLKAEAVMATALGEHDSVLIIAADTTVVAPGGKLILGKPVDDQDAFRMLKKLAGKTHTVLTGYCVLSCSRGAKPSRVVRVVQSKVTMSAMKDATIREYIQTREPMDKAGAYAAQGIGMSLLEKIQGSYSNVVGLPMAELLRDLNTKFGVLPFSGPGA